jgi:hypothetical protein
LERLRIALVISLARDACGTESNEDRLRVLMSNAEIELGGANYGCYRAPAADRVAACTNDALTCGASNISNEEMTTEPKSSCTGTFRAGDSCYGNSTRLVLGGCP